MCIQGDTIPGDTNPKLVQDLKIYSLVCLGTIVEIETSSTLHDSSDT